MTRVTFLLITLFFSQFFSPLAHASNPWVLKKEAHGIQVFLRDIPGSALKSFKGVINIPARLSSLVAVIEDTKVYPQLLQKCKSARDIKLIGNNQAYKHIVTDMPWPVKDRDTVVYSIMQQNKQSKQVEIKMKAAPKMLPLTKDIVRITTMTGRWVLIPEKNGTKVIYEMSVDPAGNLPKWLVNTISTDMPFNTLNNLRVLVKRPVYKQVKHAFIVD